MAGRTRQGGKTADGGKKPIFQYEHTDKKRVNNPPVGLVDAKSDAVEGKKNYAYDPHLDPTLVWAGKTERTSFEVPPVSLHVHERIDPRSILEAVRKKNGNNYEQLSLFNSKSENPPLREAIDFYKHAHNWSNRLVAGDSLLVMNSLLEKEGMAGKIQMVYFDPPYGIRYGSNFQPFVNKRDVKDGKDEDLTTEPEMVKAFRDTWELGIHSYLSYLRDRLLLARELLVDSGSAFVQISDENVHHVREIMDEVFGAANCVSLISFAKTSGATARVLATTCDYLLWYARDAQKLKYRELFLDKQAFGEGAAGYSWLESPDGSRRKLSQVEMATASALPPGTRLFKASDLTSQRQGRPAGPGSAMHFPIELDGKTYLPPGQRGWTTTRSGIERLASKKRLFAVGDTLSYVRYFSDFPCYPISNSWTDTGIAGFASDKVYVVQTSTKVTQRCLLMTTDPGDLVLDITCGSGTTAAVAEQWGRRWITCDTSRVALTLAKQRLMTAIYDFYRLAHPDEGVGSGFQYKTVPHITLKCLANNEPSSQETLYDQPLTDTGKARVTGPFTVEAVPAPMVKSPGELAGDTPVATMPADESVARSGATVRQDEWRNELLRAGIRGKGGQMIRFSRIEPMPGTRWLHADAETKPNDDGTAQVHEGAAMERQRVVVSFGPEHAPLEQRQVEQALEEARKLVPKPQIVVFAAFQFDPEAAKDIDEINWPGIMVLKAQMNADMLTEDLKKKRASNESFWLIGQPDVTVRQIKRGDRQGEWEVEIHGFDYYNTKTGQIESGGADKVAVWMLDTDYDGRSLFPRQVFFPMAGEKEGWSKLARNLKAELDEALIEAYRGTLSLPFELGKFSRVAVKIVDDRGIESLKVIHIE
ncbi:MAG: site-specific DNA-methyltransferase [Kiritimatiellae bacterium]|nr:site-specific DNA-methyltransferase [Kiritimatiellia bacterium]